MVIKDLIPKQSIGQNISRIQWNEELDHLKSIGFPDAASIESIPWQQIRSITKAMVLKYQKKPDSQEYKSFLALARCMWRQSMEED